MTRFNPNQVSFYAGAVRAERAAAALKVDLHSKIVTSRDPEAMHLKKALPVANAPAGFTKWQLPFVFDKGLFFMTVADPNAKAEAHSHDEGDGIRFIVSGSIEFEGRELKAGDWMYIPAGVKYGFAAGPKGATMAYCYQCCCAGAVDIRQWLPDPASPAQLKQEGLID